MSPRLELINRHGSDPIAVSTVQPGLSYFDTPNGYVAYQRAFGVALSLGGPVCAPEHSASLAQRFLDEVPHAALFYVNEQTARGVHGLHFRAALGTDRILDLTRNDTFAGAPALSAARKAEKAGFQIELMALDDDDIAFIHRVNASALQRSVVPYEMRFLNRPMTYAKGGPSHVFALSVRGGRFGYAVIDPYFEAGEVKGYLLNLLRFEPTKLWGVYLAAVQAIAARLAVEGVRELSLGFCPLARLDLEGSSLLMRPQLRWMQKRFGQLDYLARLHAMKAEPNGRWEARYLVTRTPQLLTPMLSFLELTGVPVLQLARERLRAA